MEFITVEQFQEQPKEIQQVFLDWWQPKENDIHYGVNENKAFLVRKYDTDYELWNHMKTTNIIIPLFTEGQLRKFIENKTGCKLDVMYYVNSYNIRLTNGLDNINVYEFLGTNVLQAYWKVACQIAKELL